MPIYTFFSQNAVIEYKSRLCSKAMLFVLFVKFVTYAFPFVVAYRSRGLWIKNQVFYEQPQIQYEYKHVLVGITNDSASPIFCSSFEEHEFLNERFDACTFIEVEEFDLNKDGKVDEFNYKMKIRTENSRLIRFTLLLPIEYKLHTDCLLTMQSLVIIQQELSSLLPTTKLEILGDVKLKQTEPLSCFPLYNEIAYNYSAVLVENEFSLYAILDEYSKRTISIKLENVFYVPETSVDESIFLLNIKLRYVEDSIRYRTGFWQVIKWALVQYLPLYLLTMWLMDKFQSYIFEQNLLFNLKIIPWDQTNRIYY